MDCNTKVIKRVKDTVIDNFAYNMPEKYILVKNVLRMTA